VQRASKGDGLLRAVPLRIIMAGLDPAIHALIRWPCLVGRSEDVDHRDKPGDDGLL